ncbi:MAG: ribbon-helix-helix protein, CopG family [Candidatus Thermoplasmatota archaeon]
MAVISISLSGAELDKFDKLVEHFGYHSRSSAVRDALHHFITRHQMEFDGQVHLALTLVYVVDNNQEKVSRVLRRFEGLVRTSLHHHLEETCVDALSLHGEGPRIHELLDALTKLDGVRVTPAPI